MGDVVDFPVTVTVDGVTFDRTEWFAVARLCKPDITAAEYEAMWHDYLEAKAEHLRELNS